MVSTDMETALLRDMSWGAGCSAGAKDEIATFKLSAIATRSGLG